MSIRTRVNQVLANWCGVNPPDQQMSLENLWTITRNNPTRPHDGVAFQPEGVQDLRLKLESEFLKPGVVRKKTSVLRNESFKPNGDVNSVDDLVQAVVGCPNLPPSPQGGVI